MTDPIDTSTAAVARACAALPVRPENEYIRVVAPALAAERDALATIVQGQRGDIADLKTTRDELKQQLDLYRRSAEMLCGELDHAMTALAMLAPGATDRNDDVQEP